MRNFLSLSFKAAATSFVHSRGHTAAQPRICLEMEKSSRAAFLLPGWFLGLQDAHFQILPKPKDRVLISASCPAKSPGDRDYKQFKRNKLSETNRTNITQWQGWLANVCQPKPPQALRILLPVAAGNLGIALGQRPGLQSSIGAAEAKPFSASSLLHCYHQENPGNAVNPRSVDQAG